MSQLELNEAAPERIHRGALATLRAEPAFSRMLLSAFISGLGDWFSTVALLGLALRLTGSPLAVGLTLALRTLPELAIAPLAGALADRAPRKAILLITDLLASVAALSFLLADRPARVWALYAGTLALVILSALRAPAGQAVTRMLVAPESLLAANGLEGMADGSVRLLGAALGGLAAGLLGPTPAFLINAASFLLSAALVASVRIPTLHASTHTHGWGMLMEVWPIVRDSRALRLLLALATLWPIGGGAVNILLTIYPTQVFHAGDLGIGTMYGAIGVGFLFGGWLAPRLAQRTTLTLTMAFVVEGALQIAVSQAPTLPLAVAALALATGAAGVGNACSATILMRATPENALGRVYALMGVLSSVTFGLSLLGASSLLTLVSPRTLGALAGGLILCVGLMTLAMRSFIRNPVAVAP